MNIDEAVERTTEFLNGFLRSRQYFHPQLSKLDPGVTLAPLILQLAYESGPGTIRVIFTLDRALDREDPDPAVHRAIAEAMSALMAQHPELAGFTFETRVK